MNIIFLMKVFEIGGQEVVTATLAKTFVDHGHNVSIVSFTPPNPKMVARLDKRVIVHTLNGYRYSKSNVRRLNMILREGKTDIVINQWGLPFLPTFTLKKAVKGLNVKVIAVYHNDPSTNGKLKYVENVLNKTTSPLKKELLKTAYRLFKFVTSASMRYVYNNSDRYVVLSDSFINGFQKFTHLKCTEKLSVISNPVTVDAHGFKYDFTQKRNEILFVGRLDNNQKRVDRVISTWASLEKYYPDWRLTIVGDGADRNLLEDQVRESGLKRVYFEGFQNPLEYYKRASILLLTSEFEGFGLVLIEGMKFGVVPVVYGSYPSVFDIIGSGIDGTIVMPDVSKGFDVNMMAKAVRSYLEDEKLLQQTAQAAINKSRSFSVETIARQWNSVFVNIRKSGGGKS